MAAVSKLTRVSGWVQAWLAQYIERLRIKPAAGILRLIFTLTVLNSIRRVIYTRYFHPLSHVPGSWTNVSYFFTAIGQHSGRSHYLIAPAHKHYGKVMRVAPEIVSVADKDAIREILVTVDYPKSIIHERLELNGQHSLFSSRNKDFHKNRRRLVAPAFGLSFLRTLEPIMHDCIQVLLRKIDQVLDDQNQKGRKGGQLNMSAVNVCSFMNRLSLDIIGETAFGQSFGMVLHDNHPVPKLMAESLKRSSQQVFNPILRLLVPVDNSFFKFGAERVQARKDAIMKQAQDPSGGHEGRRADLLQYLIDAQERERVNGQGETGNAYEDMIAGKLTDKALETETVLFLIAGSETSSTAMTHTLMFLVRHPDLLTRLYKELALATASNPEGSLPTYDQIRNLPFLTACINESLRLRPVAANGIPREVPEDTTMAGYFIPRGTIVMAHTPSLHWNPDYFPEPTKFIPSRWIPEESPFPNNPIQEFTFYPFSAGTRNCVGKNFAMMEMRLILATLVLAYEMEDVPNQRTDYVQFITTALATEKYMIRMKRR